MTNLPETCRVAPPPHTVADQSLPLIFLDYRWLSLHPMDCLLFYDIPNCTKPYFLENLVPRLKQSLSLTLTHFFPLAGNVVHPFSPDKKPEIRYRAGDSVSFTVSESGHDFDDLVGNHARDADKFYDFVTPLEQRHDEESNENVLETLSVQVTLFPGRGVCICFSTHHSLCDATSIVGFIKTWALINNLGGDDDEFFKVPKSLPVFSRSLINYPLELDSIVLNRNPPKPAATPSFPTPTNRVRTTFVLTQSQIKKLKVSVQERLPELSHVSSFVVMAAYVWNCLAKSLPGCDEDEPEFLLFQVDCRARVKPPVPENYFGNCLSGGLPKIRHGELVGEEGFFAAAAAIAEEIQNRVIKNEDILSDGENRSAEIVSAVRQRILFITGHGGMDLYSADFGWGMARKMEVLSIDRERYAIMVCRSRDFNGVEISLSLPKLIMDDFADRFFDGINT